MPLGQILTNGYFYLGCASTVLVVAQLFLIMRRAHYSNTVYWLQLYICALSVVSGAQLGQFFGHSAKVFDIAQSFFMVAIILYPICVVYFVLHFLNLKKWIESFWLPMIIMPATIIFLVLGLRTYAVYAQDPALR